MALGTDQGGSLRLPACWCGMVGHKPTWGLVPYTGIGILEPSLDHAGPIAKNVHDCALLLEVRIVKRGFVKIVVLHSKSNKAICKIILTFHLTVPVTVVTILKNSCCYAPKL